MQPTDLADASHAPHAATGNPPQRGLNGGRFDFDDGGTYCGGWDDGKAHGHGVCTGPKARGAYAGSWHFGFEVSGVYIWPSGSTYEGQWQNGKRHGLGDENRNRWIYRGEWTQGYKGRYGVRQSTISSAKYEGTWANGLQDGYGSETYADGGTYQGQWMRGFRHGYGVRTSAPFGLASHYRGGARHHRGSLSSLPDADGAPDPSDRRTHRMDDARGGFVLTILSDERSGRRGSLFENKKRFFPKLKPSSVGDLEKHGSGSVRSGGSGGSASSWVSSVESSQSAITHASYHTNSNTSFIVEDEHLDANVTETYMGEWKNDKRTGFGISERSDGLRYEGEWVANRKYGYGVTTFRDGTREEGKYKNNVLITSQKRKYMFLMRSAKFRERVDSAVNAAQRASKIASQKADIAISRTATARGKAEQSDEAADQAKEDCDIAQMTAKQFAPDFKHPGFERIGLRDKYRHNISDAQVAEPVSQEPERILDGKSIPNHIPPIHPQLPQMNTTQNAIPSTRTTAPYSNTSHPADRRLANNTNYNTDNRALGPPHHDSYYTNNQDSWSAQNTQPSMVLDNQKAYLPNDPNKMYGPITSGTVQPPPSSYRLNQQDSLQHKQNVDQTGQEYINQGRRPSTAVRPMMTPRQSQQEWNSPALSPPGIRPQNIPNQNTFDQHGYIDGGPSMAVYGRNDNRGGNPHSDGPIDKQSMAMDHQPYRQHMDNIQVYHQLNEQDGLRHPSDPQYRQTDNQFRAPGTELDGVNGSREPRAPGPRPSIDYFDHYKRPPSRDSSVDRYGRRSRQPSVEAAVPISTSRSGSVAPQTISRPASRAATPAGNGHLASARSSISRASSREHQPFEESLLRKRTLGQEITPSPYQPKRTESLYVAQAPAPPPPAPKGGGGGRKMLSTPQTLQRKKSLPDVASIPRAGESGMSREEVSALGSARREEVRRMHEETEKLRANPLLYLVSPQVKDWFSRQQLVILVLFINISLGIMFFKLLT